MVVGINLVAAVAGQDHLLTFVALNQFITVADRYLVLAAAAINGVVAALGGFDIILPAPGADLIVAGAAIKRVVEIGVGVAVGDDVA